MEYMFEFEAENCYQNNVELRRRTLAKFFGLSSRIILEASCDITKILGHSVGCQKTVDFLFGADSSFMRANALNSLPHYGIFALCRKMWIVRLVELLRETGYLVTSNGFRPVLILSEEAEELLRNPEELPLLPCEVLSDPVVGPTCPNSLLEKKFRNFRARLARIAGIHPKHLISDQLLRGLCHRKPQTRDQLNNCLSETAKQYSEVIWKILQEKHEEQSH